MRGCAWSRLGSESGIAFPVAILALAVVLILVGVAGAVAVSTESQSRRDVSVKQALAAADSGVQVAVYHLQKFRPGPGQCVEWVSGSYTLVSGVSTDWCPPQTEVQDDGTRVAFRVTSQHGDDPLSPVVTRRIVALGMDNCSGVTDASAKCVMRRVAISARSELNEEDAKIGVYASNDLEIKDDKGIAEHLPDGSECSPVGGDPDSNDFCGAKVLAGGNVTLGRRSSLCGMLTMIDGKQYWNKDAGPPSDCLGAPVDASGQPRAGTSPDPYDDPPASWTGSVLNGSWLQRLSAADFDQHRPRPVVLPSDIAATSANCRLNTAFGKPGGCPAPGGVSPDTLSGGGASTMWDPTTRALRIQGSGAEVHLYGGTYNFCYLEVRGGKLFIHPVVKDPTTDPVTVEPAEIWIDSPENCDHGDPPPVSDGQAGIGWGSVYFHGNAQVLNQAPNSNPGKVQFLVAGSAPDTNDGVIVNSDKQQQWIMRASNSHVEVTNESSGAITKVIAESLVVSGNGAIRWDDRAAEPGGFDQLPYARTAWVECTVQPTVGNFNGAQPDSGCSS